MYKGGKPVRDRNGKIVKAAAFQSSVAGKARVQPDRRWFGNTRVIGQAELDRFREEMSKQVNDPYQVVLRQSKLPMSLLTEAAKAPPRMDLLGAEPFSATFGSKAVRKRPKLAATSVEELLSTVSKAEGAFPRARARGGRVLLLGATALTPRRGAPRGADAVSQRSTTRARTRTCWRTRASWRRATRCRTRCSPRASRSASGASCTR